MTRPHRVVDYYDHWEQVERLVKQRDDARATADELLVAMERFVNNMLEQMTESDSQYEAEAPCPCCYFLPGSFHSADPEDHHDNCPWPGVLTALRKAHGGTER